jgi:hypothetical protein
MSTKRRASSKKSNGDAADDETGNLDKDELLPFEDLVGPHDRVGIRIPGRGFASVVNNGGAPSMRSVG